MDSTFIYYERIDAERHFRNSSKYKTPAEEEREALLENYRKMILFSDNEQLEIIKKSYEDLKGALKKHKDEIGGNSGANTQTTQEQDRG